MDPGTASAIAKESLSICIKVGKRIIRFIKDYRNTLKDVETLEQSVALANGTAEEFQNALDSLPQSAHIKVRETFDRLNLLFGKLDALLEPYTSKNVGELSKAWWAISGKATANKIKGEIDQWIGQVYPLVLTYLVRVGVVTELAEQKSIVQKMSVGIEELRSSIDQLPGLQAGIAMRVVKEAMGNSDSKREKRGVRVQMSTHTVVINMSQSLEIKNPAIALEDQQNRQVNFTFAKFTPSGSQSISVFLEHRPYDTWTESAVQQSSEYIAHIINKVDTERFNVPKCLGYFNDFRSSCFSLIFGCEFIITNIGEVRATSYTLADAIDLFQKYRIKKWAPTSIERILIGCISDLESRKTLAIQLVRALSYIHAVELVHKSLRSSNILLCVDVKTGTQVFPLIVGFHRARPVTEVSNKLEDSIWNSSLYRHPSRWAKSDNLPFIPEYDVYSLGIILLELGIGQLAKSIAVYDHLIEQVPLTSSASESAEPPSNIKEIPAASIVPLGQLAITDSAATSDVSTAAPFTESFSKLVVEKFIKEAERLKPKQGITFYEAVKECLLLGHDETPENSYILSDILDRLLSLKY